MSDGPAIPGDLVSAARIVFQLSRLAQRLRLIALAQSAQLRALSGWLGRAHGAWVDSAEQVARGCIGVAATLDEVVRVLDYFRRSIGELRARATSLGAQARVAHLEITPDATVRPAGPAMPCTALTSATGGLSDAAAGPSATPGSWQDEVAGRHLAGLPDPWRAVQLEIAALVDDTRTVYAVTLAGLRAVADDYDRASVAPTGRGWPDGGGYAIGPVGAAALLAQLPAARDDLTAFRNGQRARLLEPRARRPAALPSAATGVIQARSMGRTARMTAAALALDKVVATAGRLPVVPAVASYPVGRLMPLGPAGGVLERVPVVDVLLAGYAVSQDVSDRGYSLPAAVGREGASAAAGLGAAQATGYVLVALGGPPAAAAIIALGIGLLAGDLVARAYDRTTGHG
jgi:hypothetical protein